MLVVTSAKAGPAVTARTPTSVPAARTVPGQDGGGCQQPRRTMCAPAPYCLMTECSHVSHLPNFAPRENSVAHRGWQRRLRARPYLRTLGEVEVRATDVRRIAAEFEVRARTFAPTSYIGEDPLVGHAVLGAGTLVAPGDALGGLACKGRTGEGNMDARQYRTQECFASVCMIVT